MASIDLVTSNANTLITNLQNLVDDTALSERDLQTRVKNIVIEAFKHTTDQRLLANTLVALIVIEDARQSKEIHNLSHRVENLTKKTEDLSTRMGKVETRMDKVESRIDQSEKKNSSETVNKAVAIACDRIARRAMILGSLLFACGLVAQSPTVMVSAAMFAGFGFVSNCIDMSLGNHRSGVFGAEG